MDTKRSPEVWDRLTNESGRAYEAFKVYMFMSPAEHSLTGAWREWTEIIEAVRPSPFFEGWALMYGYGDGDFMYGGDEAGVGDKMRGGGGPDLINGQGGNDVIYGGPGSDTLKTGRGSDRVEAKDGNKDYISCRGTNDLVNYDRGLDVLEGCGGASTGPGQPLTPIEPGEKVLIDHKGKKELCLPEAALGGHLKHGDEVLNWSGCSEQQ